MKKLLFVYFFIASLFACVKSTKTERAQVSANHAEAVAPHTVAKTEIDKAVTNDTSKLTTSAKK